MLNFTIFCFDQLFAIILLYFVSVCFAVHEMPLCYCNGPLLSALSVDKQTLAQSMYFKSADEFNQEKIL